jgi:hypothetical protein
MVVAAVAGEARRLPADTPGAAALEAAGPAAARAEAPAAARAEAPAAVEATPPAEADPLAEEAARSLAVPTPGVRAAAASWTHHLKSVSDGRYSSPSRSRTYWKPAASASSRRISRTVSWLDQTGSRHEACR